MIPIGSTGVTESTESYYFRIEPTFQLGIVEETFLTATLLYFSRLLGNFLEAAKDLRTACKIDFDEQADEWLKEVTPNVSLLSLVGQITVAVFLSSFIRAGKNQLFFSILRCLSHAPLIRKKIDPLSFYLSSRSCGQNCRFFPLNILGVSGKREAGGHSTTKKCDRVRSLSLSLP